MQSGIQDVYSRVGDRTANRHLVIADRSLRIASMRVGCRLSRAVDVAQLWRFGSAGNERATSSLLGKASPPKIDTPPRPAAWRRPDWLFDEDGRPERRNAVKVLTFVRATKCRQQRRRALADDLRSAIDTALLAVSRAGRVRFQAAFESDRCLQEAAVFGRSARASALSSSMALTSPRCSHHHPLGLSRRAGGVNM